MTMWPLRYSSRKKLKSMPLVVKNTITSVFVMFVKDWGNIILGVWSIFNSSYSEQDAYFYECILMQG